LLVLFFLSSGLFLGWSLGANDAANVFGTAVGSRMIRFATAALTCSVFVVLGAVFGGAGAAGTLSQLGAIDAMGGAFMVAFAAAVTVTAMTRLGLPVSTSQAVVGAIIGWNFFSGVLTDTASLTKIVATWVICPILSGAFAALFYVLTRRLVRRLRPHLLWDDMATRWALIAVGAFGSYSLGANNIGNVMGVFVPVAPFPGLELPFGTAISGTQQLFLLGGLAIALGVFTYSRHVMGTVGGNLFKLTPQMALVVVMAHSVVLFLFASQRLEHALLSVGLPALPLVPVSSSQAVIGAVVGLGLLKGGHGIRYRVLVDIAAGWVTTPIIACLLAFVGLFVLQNVFAVPVNRPHAYELSPQVIERVDRLGLPVAGLESVKDGHYTTQFSLNRALRDATGLDAKQRERVVRAAEVDRYLVDPARIAQDVKPGWFEPEQIAAVKALVGREYRHSWQLLEELESRTPAWRLLPESPRNRLDNDRLKKQRRQLLIALRAEPGGAPAVE
jgi:PiT family inorganic phosphate transporter